MKSIFIKLLALSLIAHPLAANPFVMQSIKNPQTIALVRATINVHKANTGILTKNLQRRNYIDGMPGSDRIPEMVFSSSSGSSNSSGGGSSPLQVIKTMLVIAGFGAKFFKDKKNEKTDGLAAGNSTASELPQSFIHGFGPWPNGYAPNPNPAIGYDLDMLKRHPEMYPEFGSSAQSTTPVSIPSVPTGDGMVGTAQPMSAGGSVGGTVAAGGLVAVGTGTLVQQASQAAATSTAETLKAAIMPYVQSAWGWTVGFASAHPYVAGSLAFGAVCIGWWSTSSSTSSTTGCNTPTIEKPTHTGCGDTATNPVSTQGGSTIPNPILEQPAGSGCEYPIEKPADISTMEKGKNQTKIEEKKSENDERLYGAQAPGKPTEADGFVPRKNWDGKKVTHPKTGQVGYPDEHGNVWVPTGPGSLAHGGPHWDVVSKDGRRNKNVLPGGRIRGEK